MTEGKPISKVSDAGEASGAMAAFDAIVALGSNVGDKASNIAAAIKHLDESEDVTVVARSRDFKTPPWGKTDQDWFVNSCVSVATALSPHKLLARCLLIERKMGRARGEKWGPRVIDLDVLVYGDQEIRDSDLIVPHPYITERAFVLAPMADVAPDLVLKGKTVSAWLAGISTEGVEPMA